MSTGPKPTKAKRCILAAVFALGMASAPASADMLPMVVDQTQGDTPVFWWSSARPELRGPIDHALFSNDVHGVIRPDTHGDFSVSRVFRRPQLSVVNAQQMARMTGATTFFLGEARSSTTEVRWLDSTAATVTIQGELYDARSGTLLGNVEIIGRGVSSTANAAIDVAARSAAKDLSHFQPGRAQKGVDASHMEIVVHAHDSAKTFETLRAHVSGFLADKGALNTCRASEGEVALCVQSDTLSDDTLRRIVVQNLEQPVRHLVIDELIENENRIHINAHTPRETDSTGNDGRSVL